MNIVGLPGINPWTEQWMKDLIKTLDLGQTSTYVHRYHHWDNPGTKMNLESELASIAKEEADVVIAKSAGVVLALTGKANDCRSRKAWFIHLESCTDATPAGTQRRTDWQPAY